MENTNAKEKSSLFDIVSLGLLKAEIAILPIITVVCLFNLATNFSSLV